MARPNPLIALSGNPSQIGANLQSGRINRLAAEGQETQNEAGQLGVDRAKKLAELESIARTSMEIQPFLSSPSVESQKAITDILDKNIARVLSTGADPRDSQLVRDLVASGDFETASKHVGQALEMASRFGVITPAPTVPVEAFSNVRDLEGGGIGGVSSTTGKFGPISGTENVLPKKPLVSIVNEADEAGLTEEQKAAARSRVTRVEKIADAAFAAQTELDFISQARNIDVETNPGEGFKLAARELGAAFGLPVDLEKIVSAQAFNAVAGRMVLNVMSTQKGPQTDADQERIARTLPSLTNAPAAKEFLMDSSEAIARRKIEQSEFYTDFFDANNTYKGADKTWNEFKRNTPLLSDNVKDPDTGLPVFFFDYETTLRQLNPGMSREEIITRWQSLTSGKR
jgi:hypothetical protein